MAEHYRHLSVQEDRVLAEIATGTSLPRCHPATLRSLERKGLIERLPDEIIGRDAFGDVAIPQYAMPIPEHIAWCQWAAAQDGDDDA